MDVIIIVMGEIKEVNILPNDGGIGQLVVLAFTNWSEGEM